MSSSEFSIIDTPKHNPGIDFDYIYPLSATYSLICSGPVKFFTVKLTFTSVENPAFSRSFF